MLLAASAGAQEPQFRQLQQAQPPPTVLLPGQRPVPVSPEDEEEIGRQYLLKRRVGVPQFAVSGDAQEYFTSNRLLESADKRGDFVFVGTAVVAWNPTWIKDVQSSVYARQQFFRYNDLTDIDFDATAFGFNAGGMVEDWFNVSGGYSVTRLITRADEDEFYKEGNASLVLSRNQMFGQRVSVPYGYSIDYYHATPDDFTRVTHGFFAGVNWAATSKLLCQFLYRYQFEDYQEVSRDDRASIFSLMAAYHFTSWASVRAFVSWMMNDSSIRRDYEVFNGGAGVNVLVRF